MALAIASLALVLWLLVLQVDRVSPGPLSAVHVREPELSTRDGCARCHGEHGLAMADACGECHAEITADIAAASGFHGTLADGRDVRDCARCHGEHAGPEFALVSTHSFAAAGFATREAYDHGALDFLLEGRHATLACAECHANADMLMLPAGEPRFLGLDQGCQSCHEDAHEGRIASACAECHGQEHPFALVASFAHDRFETECAHAAVSCQQCHPRGGAHDAELLAGHQPPACARACQSCHASPHGESFTAAADVLAGVAAGDSCAECHGERHGTFAGHTEEMPLALHAASGFALDPPHATLACAACHLELVGDETGFGVHDPARTQDECRACHGDPHRGQFTDTPFGADDCLACHAREFFEPSLFGPEAHARSDFALVASHEAVACSRCHPAGTDDAPRRFEGTRSACADCHADAHRGAFDGFENPEGCARCHEPTLFSEHLEGSFEHGEWTDFALEGAHARAECTSCHRAGPASDENGRRFGFAAEVFGEPVTRCATCHADVHDGHFDRPGLPRELAGKESCERCHTSEDFTHAAALFQTASFEKPAEHERWTGYPMADFHAAVECAQCHVPAAKPDELGRSFGRAGKRCADCHQDPHVAQFAVAGVTDCARCHEDAGGLAFDHRKDSRFPLDEQHGDVECAKCHVPWPLPGGGMAVRYKPLGVECVDCHDPDFLRRAERNGRRKSERGGFAPRGGGR
jgi:cytochrome c3-like protein